MRVTHRPTALWLTSLAATLALGCAKARLDVIQAAPTGPMVKPPVVLVYDFAVTPEEALTDSFGTYSERAGEAESKEIQLAHATAVSLSEQLVAKLQKKGIAAERALDDRAPPLHAFVVRGQFLDVDKGSRLKRMVIGFGAGSSKLVARVQVYQAVDWGLRRIAEAEATATGSKAPGMAVPVGGGVAMGAAATSAAISGGMNIFKEVRGGMHADAGRMAEQIAKRAEAYYRSQGWL
ncbi:MAG: DUF4410 domain-containing protein [Myxococcales bacterium]|nr:DUF4410 domain-containing protein [Myxococcales bacterium]